MKDLVCWTVMEGVAGMESQCCGLAEALGLAPVVKRVFPRLPWLLLPAGAWPWPFAALGPRSDRLDPPWPDILISCGRKAVPYSLAVKRASGGRCFTIHIQDPLIDPRRFDLVAAPRHDGLSGPNVIVTRGALHPVTPAKLAAAAAQFRARLANLPRPLVAVLIGGANGRYRLGTREMARLAGQLKRLAETTGAGLCVTPSRRTGTANEAILRAALAELPAFVWDGSGDNPYLGFLALADHILVTADSVSMISEACATGKPVYILDLPGGSRRFRRFHAALTAEGCTRPYAGRLEQWRYKPVLDAADVAAEAERRLAARRGGEFAEAVGNPL
jgi:mitochondrial fission protein ELM1